MKKPTYSELLDIVSYLAVRADYENLPMRDEPRAVVEYAVKNATLTSFPLNDENDANSE